MKVHRALSPVPAVVPAVVLAVVLAVGCAGGTAVVTTTTSDPAAAAATGTPATDLPTTYEFVLTSSCGERNLLGDYRVVVRGGEVSSVVGLDPGYPYRPGPGDVPTLADLLTMAGSAGPDAEVDLVQDPDGIPVSLAIDHVPNGVDDEECYEVSELRVGPP